jgi:hypothetical protein
MFELSAIAAGPVIAMDDATGETTILVGTPTRQALVAPRTVALRQAFGEESRVCRFCGTGIERRKDRGWIHAASDNPECTTEEAVCPACHGPVLHSLDESGQERWVHTGAILGQPAAHEVPPPVATRALPSLVWLDAVGIEIDERARTLTIMVSVLDEGPVLPVTELVLVFREEDGGDLLLELPQPSRKLRITPLGGGRYLL